MHDPSRVRGSGPLEVFAAGFAAELARLGYRRTPATFQLMLMAHASRWLHGEGLGAGELTSEVVERFLEERRAAGWLSATLDKQFPTLEGSQEEIVAHLAEQHALSLRLASSRAE